MRLNKLPLELLNSDEIKAFIQPERLALLSSLSVFNSIGSTNSYLLECAKSGAKSGSVCIAEQQSHGRGRQGRHWYSPPGASIYFSLLWKFPIHCELSALSLAVGVMLVRCLQRYGVPDLLLKWPNDVLGKGRKLAGILLETTKGADGRLCVVIGVGVNLQLPSDADPHWIDIAEITGGAERNRLVGLLIDEMLTALPVFAVSGFAAFQEDWALRDALYGRVVNVVNGGEQTLGIVKGVNTLGELQLETDAGIKMFHCGEVSVRMA